MYAKKKFTIFFFFIFTSLIAVFGESLSISEQQAIDDFMLFRVKITSETDIHQALSKIDNYQKTNSKIIASFSDEAQLILNNFLVLEKYNYMYNLNINNPEISKLILAQNSENDKWFASHKPATINKWLYCTSADINSCCMQFVSKKELVKMGLGIKNKYNEALNLDPNMSYALFGIGQWLIQAPVIFGGSPKKAIEAFEHALSSARDTAETFYACIFLSQAYFDDKETAKAENTLYKAFSIEPDSTYVSLIETLNKSNYSLYYYIVHRDKINKELNLS
jgi:tetratricopeptide (TPR) repeat protein